MSKKQSHKEDDLVIGDKAALFISRLMSSWPCIAVLMVLVYVVINRYDMLAGEKILDVFNLIVSLYTIFLELILLRSSISQRNMDRALAEKIDKTLTISMANDRRIIAMEENILKLLTEKAV